MGKRELLLIAAFVIVGAIVYQFTAPAPAPGERSFAPGQILDHVRRAMRGNRASAEVVTKSTYAVGSGVSELGFTELRSAGLTITGEDRPNIEAELLVHSNGYDDDEAQRLAKETRLRVDPAGSRLTFSVDYPQPGAQRATITMKVPFRLAVKLQSGGRQLTISKIAALELGNARGTVDVREVTGPVSGAQRGGELHVTNAGSIKLSTNGVDVRLEQIRGEVAMTMRGGELKAKELAGPIDLDTQGVDITLEKLEKTTGVVRINAIGESLKASGLRTEARFDVRSVDVEVSIDRAAPLAIYSEGGESIEVTPPSGGYQLDAVTKNGEISVPEGTIEVTTSGKERRASGPIHGGGPTITLRSAHGDITVKER
jgi:putative adhesin